MTELTGSDAPALNANARRRRFGIAAFGDVLAASPLPAHATRQQRVVAIALVGALAVGSVVRLIAALSLSPHVDEASSVLAAHAVAERGLPILPSGTAYFQGATLSYLLQPLLWLGFDDIDDLKTMRMLLVAAGTVTLYLCYRLGLAVTGDARVGVVMAALVAIDPVSVQWSGHMRMYGMLQALTVGLAWAYIRLLQGHTSWRQIALVSVLFWAAVFTHVGAALLGPAMAVAAVLIHRRALARQWRLLVPLAVSALAPMTLLAFNRVLGTENEPIDEASSVPFWTFVGDNLLAPLARLRIPTEDWQSRITAGVTLYWLVPGLIVACSTIICARHYLRDQDTSPQLRTAIITLLSLYWLPILVIVTFTVSPHVRYLLHVHLIGYFLLALLFVDLWRAAALIQWREGVDISVLIRYGTIAVIVVVIGSGLFWRLNNPVVQPDYHAAMAYVEEHHQPGEPVIVTLPPVGYLTMDEPTRGDVIFLAGSQGWTRADRYTRLTDDGRLIDYWIGADSIVTTESLRQLLVDNLGAWIIADEGRLEDDWTNEATIKGLLRDATFPAYLSDGGAVVFRTLPAAASSQSQPAQAPTATADHSHTDDQCQDSVALTRCAQ